MVMANLKERSYLPYVDQMMVSFDISPLWKQRNPFCIMCCVATWQTYNDNVKNFSSAMQISISDYFVSINSLISFGGLEYGYLKLNAV